MIRKYLYGQPLETEAVTEEIPEEQGAPAYGSVTLEENGKEGFFYSYQMETEDIVYGLGEANRGINKRGHIYVNMCADDPNHTEDKASLYGAHNFIVVFGRQGFGLFVDYPGEVTFDIGATRQDTLTISCPEANLKLYVIEGEDAYDIVKQFRRIIGRSYIPPKFAFGFGQSRWGYRTQEDFFQAVKGYRENGIPIDLLYLDIDYMQDYKDFTFDEENLPDFSDFAEKMREEKIHLIPIIDAGVKIEEGYDVYEEGVKNNYFCKREDGSDFVAVVWPGRTHFPDFLRPEVRRWFGEKYKRLISRGADGFWNDMNEPAIFYSDEGEEELKDFFRDYLAGDMKVPERSFPAWELSAKVNGLASSPKDYRRFYHELDGQKVRHDKVHNLYGYNMTRAASEAFEKIAPDRRMLMFSRASYIGMHRYGGVWMGDNKSWWSHILLNLKMLPSLNMCGFLYTGADLGGFGADATRDLLLRWLALGVFTPLMRNHSALGTREQECWRFEHTEDFAHVIGVRYRLIPYLYSEYMKAALENDMMFKPLAFVYSQDRLARRVEDQLMLGDEVMIAPVYEQNAVGRCVYLPEEMMFAKFLPGGEISRQILPKGHHYVDIALNEVALFIRKGKAIPVADPARCVEEISMESLRMLGYEGASYRRYDDDGITPVTWLRSEEELPQGPVDIRKAEEKDLSEVERIFARAREFQKQTGNPNQWKDGYPQREVLERDLKAGNLYVCEKDGRIVGVFAFILGEDPTYAKINGGSWLSEEPYGTIHRIASDGTVKGMAAYCFAWAFARCGNLRVDTHEDNRVMQHVLAKNGFAYCGEIYTDDGSPRWAYQRI